MPYFLTDLPLNFVYPVTPVILPPRLVKPGPDATGTVVDALGVTSGTETQPGKRLISRPDPGGVERRVAGGEELHDVHDILGEPTAREHVLKLHHTARA
jgi:hypothetical protein